MMFLKIDRFDLWSLMTFSCSMCNKNRMIAFHNSKWEGISEN